MDTFAPEYCHELLLQHAPRILAYRDGVDFPTWRGEVAATLRELVGWMPEPVAPEVRVEWQAETEEFVETRFVFTAEAGADVPCHLLLPRVGQGPYPVVICLQGHSTGMHISLGRPKYDGDEATIAGGRDIAPQVVREGYAALVLEQRCFGERKDQRTVGRFLESGCHHASMVALLLGRTMIGERVWDVMRAIDVLAQFPEIDISRIACTGNSGGGTVTFYASCLDPRIGVSMPSCAICTYAASIGRLDHCHDNYLPRALQYFDMGDLAALIAPRPFLLMAGREDAIFPLVGVEETFATVQRVYAAAGAPDRCRLLVGDGGHRYYPNLAWPALRDVAGWGSSIGV